VKQRGDALFFEWRSLRVLWEDSTIYFDGPAIEPFVDRVVFPVIESLNPDSVTLHGAAIVSKKAMLLLGQSGVGKSTITRELSGRGWRFWADDVVAINHTLLKPSASSSRMRGATTLNEDFPGSGKLRLMEAPNFSATPLSSIVILKRGDPLKLEKVESVIPLMPYLYDLDPGTPELRKRRFQNLANLARTTPIFEMTFPPNEQGGPSLKQLDLIESLLS
jgi:hypothetical protein